MPPNSASVPATEEEDEKSERRERGAAQPSEPSLPNRAAPRASECGDPRKVRPEERLPRLNDHRLRRVEDEAPSARERSDDPIRMEVRLGSSRR